ARRRADPARARERRRGGLPALADHGRGPPVDRLRRDRHQPDRPVDDDPQAAGELGGLDRGRRGVRVDVPLQVALPDGAPVRRLPRARGARLAAVEAELRGGPRSAGVTDSGSAPPDGPAKPRPLRIVFTGPEAGGKTTLSRTLAWELRAPWTPDAARQFA